MQRSKADRKESAKRRRAKKLGMMVAPAAYSIPEFCIAHRISEMTFFRLKRLGLGPRTMKVLNRTIITYEAAADWRREGEIATASTDNNTIR
jgi:hypothetical protein